jgi:hypothetical protein
MTGIKVVLGFLLAPIWLWFVWLAFFSTFIAGEPSGLALFVAVAPVIVVAIKQRDRHVVYRATLLDRRGP